MTSPDTAVIKTEIFDVDALSHLLVSDGVSLLIKNRLRQMSRNATKGNELRVAYLRGKKFKSEEYGRITPEKGIGLALIERDMRNFLANKFYFDLDMVNSQPVILEQICKRKGWECDVLAKFNAEREDYMKQLHGDRNKAKQMVMTMLFGDLVVPEKHEFFNGLVAQLKCITDNLYASAPEDIKKIAKKHKKWNEKGSVCACILQQEEFKCLMALDKALCKEGRELSVLMHDGGYVRKLTDETELPTSLITFCEKVILEETGYSVVLKQKDMPTTFTIPETSDLIDPSVLIDDKYAAEVFCEKMGDHLIRCNDGIYIFNTETGIWSNNEIDVKTAITKSKLVFKQMGALGVRTFDYSGSLKSMKDCFSYLPHIIPNQPDYFLSRTDSSAFKLLFQDGIYDFKTDTFTAAFDPNIIFHCAIQLPFNKTEVAEDIAFVRQNLFENPFNNTDTPRVLLHYLMRAICGDYRMKKYIIGIGGTNSGKGTTAEKLTQTFGEYVSSFSGNSLLLRRGDTEATREMSWIHRIAKSRIAISSEMKMSENAVIDGNMLKSIVSGGDVLTLRRVYENEHQFINTSTPFIFCNDLPKFSPADEGLRLRTIVITYDYSFVPDPNPTIPSQKKGDANLKQTLKDVKYSYALFHIIRQQYIEWKKMEYAEIVLPPSMIQDKNDWVPLTDFADILSEKYEITKNPEHMVLFDDVYKEIIRTTGEGAYSKNKVGRELTALGITTLRKIVGRQTKVYRLGLRYDGLKQREAAEDN